MKLPRRGVHHLLVLVDFQLRLRKKSRGWLAAEMGYAPSTLEAWFSGRNCPNIYNVEAALNVLGLTTKATPLVDLPLAVPRSSSSVGGKRGKDTAPSNR